MGYSAGRKTTIDVTDLIWKRARMAGFSLFAQSPTAIATAWRDIIPLIVGGSVKPIVERVYPLGEAGEALRHLTRIGRLAKSSWRDDRCDTRLWPTEARCNDSRRRGIELGAWLFLPKRLGTR